MNRVNLSSVQSLSRVRVFATAWTAACQASLSITNSLSLFKLMSIESVMPGVYDHEKHYHSPELSPAVLLYTSIFWLYILPVSLGKSFLLSFHPLGQAFTPSASVGTFYNTLMLARSA